MRRLKIVFYWLFRNRNNVSLAEIIKLIFFRFSAKKRAEDFIDKIELIHGFYEIKFKKNPNKLYWPVECPQDNINMIVCETFDQNDWHYYQKANTEIVQGEILLDVGAAEGLFTLSIIDKCRKAILIEPNILFTASLSKTFADYKHKIEIFNLAVGNEEGIIEFNLDSINSRISRDSHGNQVRLTKIDYLGIEKITYLKADVEGFELEMLKGAENTIRRDKPKIAITSYHVENNADEMIGLILSFVPDYKFFYKGIGQVDGKPVMIHFWV